MSEKNYKQWMLVKASINNNAQRPDFKERDVFWTSIGENIGFEQDGKSRRFNRPVVVVRKFNTRMFLGVPLSTTNNRSKYHLPLKFEGNVSVALLSQIRVFDAKRLEDKMGMLGKSDYLVLTEKLTDMITGQLSLPLND
ncbi:MAG: type II toxin-antitoxin system PemK/MazF family toxin [Coriobacteriales bacterium]|nr:type II toxin-antitoxin system PemK/MazF family toxin [Coriobacteriales bacterium]